MFLSNFLEIYWTDVYKTGHRSMLPANSTMMVSNFTPRSGKHSNVKENDGVVSFGQQMLVRKMVTDWKINFFDRPVEEIYQFQKDMTAMLMLKEDYNVDHFLALHKLGYLPIEIRSIEEGRIIPYKVPMLSIQNTVTLDNQIYDWIVNYLETILSSEAWLAPTSATSIRAFRALGKNWLQKTAPDSMWFLDYMFHDFSMRGMGGKSSIVNSGLGFATGSRGSDTLPVIPAARVYYDEVDVCINSVIATEHAIMCTLTGFYLHKKDGSWNRIGDLEVETYRELLRRFPTGILSIVSDTWDLWRVLTQYNVILKDEILARDGKLVFRPDSGDPVDIVCGESRELVPMEAPVSTTRRHRLKGVIEILWDVFGGTVNSLGYKQLNPKVGCIYGDSINYDRAEQIFTRLELKGFAADNIVMGVGSFTLQLVSRDTHGFFKQEASPIAA